MLVAFDPGGTTGWYAALNMATPIDAGQCAWEEVDGVLDKLQPRRVVVEEFKLYPWKSKAQSWSDIPSAQVIGIIKAWCLRNDVEVVMQAASVRKLVAAGVLKALEITKYVRCMKHAKDAALHAVYYFWKSGDVKTYARTLHAIGKLEGGAGR